MTSTVRFMRSSACNQSGVEVGFKPAGSFMKSSFSNQNCVEVTFDGDQIVVRDSKQLDDDEVYHGAYLYFSPEAWDDFVLVVSQGQYDLITLPVIRSAVRILSHDVAVAMMLDGQVAMWCTCNPDTMLSFTQAEWLAFVQAARQGEFFSIVVRKRAA